MRPVACSSRRLRHSLRITVKAKPGSKVPGIDELADGTLVVRVRERAIDGAANDAVAKALAKRYKVARSKVRLIRGDTSKLKLFEVG